MINSNLLTRRAFTLIELAVVIVIIATIAGGIVIGSSLIQASKVRAVIAEQQQLKTAIDVFKTQYDCLPGDCPNASSFFSGALNGNGDNELSGLEDFRIYYQLMKAELITGNYTNANATTGLLNPEIPYTTSPGSRYSAKAGWHSLTTGTTPNYYGLGSNTVYQRRGNALIFGGLDAGSTLAWSNGILTVSDAISIDTKMDDGLPSSGNIFAIRPYNITNANRSDNVCIDTSSLVATPGSVSWNHSDPGNVCILLFYY